MKPNLKPRKKQKHNEVGGSSKGSLSNLQSDRVLANRLVQKLLIGENVTILDYFGSVQQREIRGVIIDETRESGPGQIGAVEIRRAGPEDQSEIEQLNTKKAYR